MFTNLNSGDNYPHIGWNEFNAFCRSVDILDSTIPTATVDRMFIATKVGAPQEGTGNTLFRHEFLEIMIRISNAKYRETDRASSYHEALEMLLESMIKKYETKPWQEFRDEELWTHEVDRVFKANLVSIQKVHDQVFPRYGGDGIKSCLDLVARDSDVMLSEKEARFCLGMSKMTVKDEVSHHAEYEKLRMPEFMEFLGRVAHTKYLEETELPFHAKLESILDGVFAVYGLKRKPADQTAAAESSSDESVGGGDSDQEKPKDKDNDNKKPGKPDE